MKAEASPKEHVRMQEDDTESTVETGDTQSAEEETDMIALSSDDESFSSEMQKPKAKKAKREKKPKVLTEAEHAAQVMPSLFFACLSTILVRSMRCSRNVKRDMHMRS